MAIHFFFTGKSIKLTQRNKLKAFLKQLFINQSKRMFSLTYIFCSDDYLLNINKQFLHHDYYTDIITFDLAAIGNPVEGEIYISIDRVADNALFNKISFNEELHRVIFHGALHLCGYLDKTPLAKKLMTSLENDNLQQYFTNS